MKRAFIFANGKMDDAPPILKDLHLSDLIIAADGGTQHCKALGITPNVIIGDFDSLDAADTSSYKQKGTEIIQHPTHKEETDLELALLFATNHEVTHVFIIGALGNRWDMTLANILLAVLFKFSHLSIRLLDGSDELAILRGEGIFDIKGRPGDTVSLIPLGGDAIGITTRGLVYPLADETLYFGSSRGVSNIILTDQARVIIKTGILLIYISTRGG
jgi:thiamine pyrophosphokinase